MLITYSRASSTTCWRYTLNVFHRNLGGVKGTALVDGGAVHVGIAHGLANHDWDAALGAAERAFDEEIGQTNLDPLDAKLAQDHWDLCEAVIRLFQKHYEQEDYEVLQPECSFCVPLPDSMHNCVWHHWLDTQTREEHWGIPPVEMILARRVVSPHAPWPDKRCPCYTPHYVAGQTDAIVRWHKVLWLMDHKTSSLSGDMFWNQWDLDLQPTIYIYGIWKALGIKPKGFIINYLYRPSEKQVSAWNAKRKDHSLDKSELEYLGYERRSFLRTDEDVSRVEPVLISLCNEWERRIVEGDFRPVLQRGLCDRFNHRCEFFGPCNSHEEPGAFAGLRPRDMRYDDDKIATQLVQIKEKLCQE